MKTLTFALCLVATAGFCQTSEMTTDPQQIQANQTAPTPDQSTVKPQTVRGCLNSAGDNYTVTDQVSGKTFKLEGSTDRLKQFIGQTVEISGSVKSVDGDSKPANADTGDTLTLADVKQISDKCSTVPNNGALRTGQVVLMALMQRPVNDDANTQLNSSVQMSSNAAETSAAAANTRTVSTSTEEHAVYPAGGHTGVHGSSVTTSDTQSVGETTAPTSSAAGYAKTRDSNDKGVAPMNPQAYNQANEKSEVTRDKQQKPTYLNAEGIGQTEDEGNRAAEAASRAEMQTDANGQKTSFSTMRESEENGTVKQNPKVNAPPKKTVKGETTPQPPK
ncbi:hypothetical protein Acid345_2520 [Candidatus Koribacter versatilis Ellin345]|uniref:DUF5666 domain-containing protein n=1 Tax=Koribacter versatilis (strain Ellin345) TaxID=204669 RepID=Q1INM9_KORVE|nr:hypothetical protein [Candidatus Koribacter versatilis]ABF41521.1 hypothetical protein Acid345_2520 [Candidatus Koribacter versatilis Ellin345]